MVFRSCEWLFVGSKWGAPGSYLQVACTRSPGKCQRESMYDLYSEFCPTTWRNIPLATLCFSTAAAAAPPSASHPRRPRLDAAVCGGSERPCRRGRAADLCGGQGGRGRRTRPWPRKGFRIVLRVALTR